MEASHAQSSHPTVRGFVVHPGTIREEQSRLETRGEVETGDTSPNFDLERAIGQRNRRCSVSGGVADRYGCPRRRRRLLRTVPATALPQRCAPPWAAFRCPYDG